MPLPTPTSTTQPARPSSSRSRIAAPPFSSSVAAARACIRANPRWFTVLAPTRPRLAAARWSRIASPRRSVAMYRNPREVIAVATTVYYCASSLDGYIAEADDSLDWLVNYEGTSEQESAEPDPMSEGGGYERFYEGVAALVMGSVTFEWILDHLDIAGGGEWPYRGKPCWVLSSRQLRLPEGDGVDVRVVGAPV